MIEAIRAQSKTLNANHLILLIVSVLPFMVGWLAGFVVRAAVWLVAAIVAGYKEGRGLL